MTLDDKINDVNHEIAICEIVFAKRARIGFLNAAVAEFEIAAMQAVLKILKSRRDLFTAGETTEPKRSEAETSSP